MHPDDIAEARELLSRSWVPFEKRFSPSPNEVELSGKPAPFNNKRPPKGTAVDCVPDASEYKPKRGRDASRNA